MRGVKSRANQNTVAAGCVAGKITRSAGIENFETNDTSNNDSAPWLLIG